MRSPGPGRVLDSGRRLADQASRNGSTMLPGLLDLVGADEQGGVADHGVVEQALVAVGRSVPAKASA